jgi:hypothetical protein
MKFLNKFVAVHVEAATLQLKELAFFQSTLVLLSQTLELVISIVICAVHQIQRAMQMLNLLYSLPDLNLLGRLLSW